MTSPSSASPDRTQPPELERRQRDAKLLQVQLRGLHDALTRWGTATVKLTVAGWQITAPSMGREDISFSRKDALALVDAAEQSVRMRVLLERVYNEYRARVPIELREDIAKELGHA